MTLQVATLQPLAEGYAQLIAAHTDPTLSVAWNTDQNYTSDQAGIFMAYLPTTPDRMISLSPRQLTADPTLTDSLYALQVRMRGTVDVRTVWALRDAVRDVILGRWPVTLPSGLEVKVAEFAGGTPMPRDTEQRTEWSDNFTMRVGEHRATPY